MQCQWSVQGKTYTRWRRRRKRKEKRFTSNRLMILSSVFTFSFMLPKWPICVFFSLLFLVFLPLASVSNRISLCQQNWKIPFRQDKVWACTKLSGIVSSALTPAKWHLASVSDGVTVAAQRNWQGRGHSFHGTSLSTNPRQSARTKIKVTVYLLYNVLYFCYVLKKLKK